MPIDVEIHLHFASVDDLKSIKAGLNNLLTLGEKAMASFEEFVIAQQAFNESMKTSISDITNDIVGLKNKIDAVQNAPGTLSTQQQAALDDLLAAQSSLAQGLQSVNDMTPPVMPETPSA